MTVAVSSEKPAAAVRFSEGSFRIFRRDILVYVSQIVTGAIVARTLGPRGIGLWIILQMIAGYAEPIARLQMDTAACYFLNRGAYRVGEVAFALIVGSLASAGAYVALFVWQQEWLFRSFLSEAIAVRPYVYLMLAYVPLKFLTLNYSYLMLSRDDVRGYNGVALLTGLAPSVAGAVLLLISHLGILALVLSWMGGAACAIAYGVVRVHRNEPITPHANVRLFGDLLGFGLKLYLQSVVAYLHVYVSGLIILLYMPPAQVAFFRIGQERALLLSRVPMAVGTMLYPRVARLNDQPDQAVGLTTTSIRLTLWLLLVLGLVGAAVSKPAVFVLYGRAFAGVVVPLLIFIPGVIADASTGLVGQHFTGRGRPWVPLWTTLAGLGVQLALLWVAVPRWTLLGAAAATALGYLLTAVLRAGLFCRLERVPVRDIVVLRRSDIDFIRSFIAARLAPVRRLAESSRPTGVS